MLVIPEDYYFDAGLVQPWPAITVASLGICRLVNLYEVKLYGVRHSSNGCLAKHGTFPETLLEREKTLKDLLKWLKEYCKGPSFHLYFYREAMGPEGGRNIVFEYRGSPGNWALHLSGEEFAEFREHVSLSDFPKDLFISESMLMKESFEICRFLKIEKCYTPKKWEQLFGNKKSSPLAGRAGQRGVGRQNRLLRGEEQCAENQRRRQFSNGDGDGREPHGKQCVGDRVLD